jgi:hypothetical protein
MDVANSSCHWYIPGTRKSLAVGQEGEAPTGKGRAVASDQPQQGDGLRRGPDDRHDGAHYGPGRKDDERR